MDRCARRSPHLGNRTTIGELRGIIEVDGIVVTGTADDLTYDKSRLTHVRGIDASAQISFERLMALAAGRPEPGPSRRSAETSPGPPCG